MDICFFLFDIWLFDFINLDFVVKVLRFFLFVMWMRKVVVKECFFLVVFFDLFKYNLCLYEMF